MNRTFRPGFTHLRRQCGFSFIELMVTVTVIGLLLAALLPAVQLAREASRRSNCGGQLAQLVLAIHNYQNLHEVYPPGTIDAQGPVRNIAQGYHHNWIVQILPFMEQRNAWRHVDFSVGVYHPNNAQVADLRLDILHCLSQNAPPTQSCYAAVHHDVEAPIDVDNHGVFFLNSRIRYEDIIDGSSQTLFLGEVIAEQGGLGWMSGTRATLRNMGTPINWPQLDKTKTDPQLVVGGFGSAHPAGALFALGDGSVHTLSNTTNHQVTRSLAHRADGMLLKDFFY